MTDEDKPTSSSKEPVRRTSTSSPLIFISHDNRDAELAEAFCKLLSSVSAGVLKSFRSSDRKGSQGIEYGVEWFPELMKKLETASDVVCLLTRRSLDRPWILYEAGVAKGKLDTSVYGVAIGIPLNQANTGPFAQFQNCDDKEESLTKLVLQLLNRIPDSDPDREAVQMQVKSFKQRVDEILTQLQGTDNNQEHDQHTDESSIANLFEEIKVMFQDLPSRVENRLVEGTPIRRRRIKHFHPMMLDELTHIISDDPNDPIGLLIIASLIRDDLPWFYEIIMEVYREAKSGNITDARKSFDRMRRATKAMMRGPWIEELGIHPKEFEMWMMELPMYLDHYLSRFEVKSRKKRIVKSTTNENE
ncbi:MAG: toll/interleukin-1 receptor domain-containing protein [Candidatus Latescibacteria bacterium]|nr:toll/interleukin-1 receptor domain-containing protein [Candidatus Latescibacterota bacterium]